MDIQIKEQYNKIQLELKSQVINKDEFEKDIKYVAGVDISFDSFLEDRACSYIVVMDYNTLEVVYEDYQIVRLTMPYVCGYLGFREVPHYLELLAILKNTKPEYTPDIILVDGFGTLHHRGFGSASHLGVASGIPTIGCAKTLLEMDGLIEKEIKEYMNKNKLYYYYLNGFSGQLHGAALMTGQSKPIYISIGHKITLETAMKVVKKCSKFRIPEPIRLADIKSNKIIKN